MITLKQAKEKAPTYDWIRIVDGLAVTKLMVLHSNAGFYIGRLCMESIEDVIEPYSRESDGYFPTKELAKEELKTWS